MDSNPYHSRSPLVANQASTRFFPKPSTRTIPASSWACSFNPGSCTTAINISSGFGLRDPIPYDFFQRRLRLGANFRFVDSTSSAQVGAYAQIEFQGGGVAVAQPQVTPQ